jgi:WD40 repeat protein
VKIWDVASGAELLSLPHEHFVGAVAWSGSGQRLASMDVNGCVKLWDATSAWAQVR